MSWNLTCLSSWPIWNFSNSVGETKPYSFPRAPAPFKLHLSLTHTLLKTTLHIQLQTVFRIKACSNKVTHGDKNGLGNSIPLPDPSAYQWETKVERHPAVPSTKQDAQGLPRDHGKPLCKGWCQSRMENRKPWWRIRTSHRKRDWKDWCFHGLEASKSYMRKISNTASGLEKGD